MEAEENSTVHVRRRTDSNGGNSDSDLSDGWNLVDEMDIQNNDFPSSDGESVEVIDAEEETSSHVRDVVQDLSVIATEGVSEIVVKSDCPLVPAAEREALIPAAEQRQGRESTFDYWLRWLLFFTAVTSVVISNLALMSADNVLNKNVGLETASPSFLRDLPTTPKSVEQDKNKKKSSWTNDDVSVETVDDSVVIEKENKKTKRIENNIQDKTKYNKKYHKLDDETLQKKNLKIDRHQIGNYFKVLSEVTNSAEAQNKFAQAQLILDALHIGLNDLEEVVAENSELQQVLRKQQNKLQDVISEVEFGVTRSTERLATNVLNKLLKLERKFENQWCKLEKNGHQEKLKGLFYDCQDNEESNWFDSDGSREIKQTEDNIDLNEISRKKQMIMDNYEYEVDKDSAGKLYSKPNSGAKDSDDYYKLLTSKNYDNEKYNKKQKEGNQDKYEKYNKILKDEKNGNEKHSTNKEYKFVKNEDYIKYEHDRSETNDKHEQSKIDKKYSKNKHTESNVKYAKETYSKPNNKHSYETKKDNIAVDKSKKTNNYVRHKSTGKENNQDKIKQRGKTKFYNTETDDFDLNETTIEMVSNYLKEKCGRSKNMGKMTFNSNDYQSIKDGIDDKVKIPKRIFDKLYEKYCKTNFNYFKWDSKSNKKEYLKGDKSKQNNENQKFNKKNPVVIEDHNPFVENIVEFRIVETPEVNDVEVDSVSNKVILPNRSSGRQWLFSYEEPSPDNKTDLSGEWFIKAGESRAQKRWSQRRSDWLFDRASHRRSHPQPPSWFSERHKNWFFLRARHRCRLNPHDPWCHIPEEESINVSESNSNFR